MLMTILLLIAAALALVLIYAATKPRIFLLQRSADIAAPADRVFALIQDLKGFNSWNPFAQTDPQLKLRYEAITQGVGAAYSWEGPKAGVGRMRITESLPPQRVTMSLDFTKPMTAHNKVVFSLAPQGAATRVTWAMSGDMPYMHRVVSVFCSMDRMVGTQFEKGLASLKLLAENP